MRVGGAAFAAGEGGEGLDLGHVALQFGGEPCRCLGLKIGRSGKGTTRSAAPLPDCLPARAGGGPVNEKIQQPRGWSGPQPKARTRPRRLRSIFSLMGEPAVPVFLRQGS